MSECVPLNFAPLGQLLVYIGHHSFPFAGIMSWFLFFLFKDLLSQL